MRNLTQYLKIGVGVDMVIKGSLDYYTNMVLRSSQNPDYGSIGLSIVFTTIGSALLASGIYNLAKRVRD